MPIKPIFSGLLHNKGATLLIVIQVALTFALVSNALFIVVRDLQKITYPTTLDIDNMIVVYPEGLTSETDMRQTVTDDLRTLRNMPGVIDATPVKDLPPGMGAGWVDTYFIDANKESLKSATTYYIGDEHIVSTLGLKIIAGRDFNVDDIEYLESNQSRSLPRTVLISQAMAEKLFPEGDALGKQIWQSGFKNTTRIIGIYESMRGNNFLPIELIEMTMLMPQVLYEIGDDPNYLVRVEPGLANQMVSEIEDTLRHLNPNRYIWDVLIVGEARTSRAIRQSVNSVTLITIVTLLLIITALGIVGLTAFSINKRRRQIGTRRALGARKIDILYYFLLENWLITTMGIIIGCVLTYALNIALVKWLSSDAISFTYVFATMISLWILGQLAVFFPAKRASEIEPAIATRNV